MTSSCVICATTRCTAVRQTTIITQKRQQHHHHQPLHQQQYGINNNVSYNKNKIMMINNTSNNQLRYNNNRTATAPILKKYYSTNSNTNKSLAKAISSSSNSGNNEQDNVKSIGNLLLGTAFVTSAAAALLAYNSDDNIVYADSVMATVPPVASFQVSSSRGKQQQNQSLSKDEGKKTLIMEEKKNDATEEVQNTNKVSATTTTTNTTANDNNNGIQMKEPNNQRKYNVSIRALRGGRLYMEDEYYVSDDGHFAGVFDGHGGHGVSSYLKDHLYNTIQTTLQSGANDTNDTTDTTASKKNYWDDKDDTQDELDDDEDDDDLSNDNNNASIVKYSKAIQQSITKIDNDVLSKTDLEHQGSTAVAIYLHEDIITNQRTILSANVGDSRAILSRRKKAIDLTRDHKPNEEKERNRILAMGETIEWDPFSHVYRVRNLSLSRAIGDKFAKPAISGEAEMKIFPLWEDDDEFIVLASDGLWDVMNSQDVINFVHRRINAPYRPRKKVLQQSTDALIVDLQKVNEERKRLMSRYVAHEALLRGSADNICVVIVWLKDL